MSRVVVKAFAKINLSLEVKEKMSDGYHGIETLFRGLCLHDTLYLSASGEGIGLTVSTEKGAYADSDPPADESNLAWRAADMLIRAFPGKAGPVAMDLIKRIPVSAGLGGGSADAAAALLGINRLYGLGLGAGDLRRFAAELGADVAFCLEPLAAIGRGRGEKLEATPPGPPLWVVVIKPPFGLSAGEVYGAWDHIGAGGGHIGGGDGHRARFGDLLEGLRTGKAELIWPNMRNDLEAPAFFIEKRLHAYYGPLRDAARRRGGEAMMCGSGSALAAFFLEGAPARDLAGGLGEIGDIEVILTRTLTDADMALRYS